MFVGRKIKGKTLGILLIVSMLLLLLPGVSLADPTFTTLSFVSSADYNLNTGQTSTINFNLLDNSNNKYNQAVYATIIDSHGIFQFGSDTFTILPVNGKYSMPGVNFLSAGTYYLKVVDGTNPALTVTGAINVTTSTYGNSAFINFISDSDNNLTTGVTQNINYRLYNQNGQLYTGTVSAYIQDPDGHSLGYSASSSSISNVTLDQSGQYTLYINMSTTNTGVFTATGTINVANANLAVTGGSLQANVNSTVNGILTKANGDPLVRQPFTVDATGVGGTTTSNTTLYDGSFTITMTPTSLGLVKINLGGHSVGTIQVGSAYTSGSRIGGMSADNADLSVQVAQKGWTTATNVILTRDDVVADAMVAAPLSKKLNAPILMTPTDSLSGNVAAEIKTLNAKNVYIIGGTGAVSSGIEISLDSMGLNVTRMAGVDRYDTAAQIAAQVGSTGTVYLAYGYGEPDALAAGPLAAEKGIPILLTDTNSLPASSQNALGTLKPKIVVLLGGTGVISSGLEAQLNNTYSVQRWGGADRFVTEQIILQNFLSTQNASDNQYPVYITSAYVSPSDVSSGKPFGDALMTAALAAKNNGIIITLPPNSIPNAVSYFLLFNKAYIPTATVVGNSMAISYNLEQSVQQVLSH